MIQLTVILALGTGLQWLAWKLKQPSITFLLGAGFLAGPVFGIIDVDVVFGHTLFPIVSLAVSVILFEGGLSLGLSEYKWVRSAVRRLLLIGVPVTWLLAGWAAYMILGVNGYLAALLGAILTVTGPTVIIPLLRSFEMEDEVRSILKWEGILVDPLGALLSVVAFEVLLTVSQGDYNIHFWEILLVFVKTILIGGGIGFAIAAALIFFFRREWIPEFLHNPMVLSLVLLSYATSNYFQKESGLLTVTVMGFVMANQKYTMVRHVIEFKENLRVLLISTIFIILSARIDLSIFYAIGWEAVLYVLVLIFVVRPASVFISTLGVKINFREKIFFAFMAPRGIVAAAVSTVFALELGLLGMENTGIIESVVFLVIVVTVNVYGFAARPLAFLLGLGRERAQGVLFAGANRITRSMGKILQERHIPVVLVDTNPTNVQKARMMGLTAVEGNILDEYIKDETNLAGIGRLVAMTDNDEINSLASLKYRDIFGRNGVYQVAPGGSGVRGARADRDSVPMELRGRCLFERSLTMEVLRAMFVEGGEIKATRITKEFTYEKYREYYGEFAYPLFLITENGDLIIETVERPFTPHSGQTIIGFVKEWK